MKTAIIFKWQRDPRDARVASDGTVTWPGVKLSPTDDDPAAMDIAKALCPEGDIVGITIGDGKPEWAAARGAASTVIVEDAMGGSDGSCAASALAAALREEGADVAVIGDSGWDSGVVSALAGELGWTAYAGVTGAQLAGDDIEVKLKRQGGLQTVRTKPPVLLAAVALGQEKDVPGMKQTLAARKKPSSKITTESLGLLQDARSESVGTQLPEGACATMIDGSDSAQAAKQLVEALRADGTL